MTETKNQPSRPSPWELAVGPSQEHWEDWVELDATAWPKKVERHYRCIPTICFNCESGCGLLAFVDKSTGRIEKFEGNPVHPGSRGRTCAKGPATINQVNDTERILTPLKRVGKRGEGRFEEVSWEDALDDIGGRIGKALRENRKGEVVYHVGRPGDDHFVMRMLAAWGIDGHNSHTTVCSGAARLGYSLWFGADRPSPDYAASKFMLLISAHLETGHYFNPTLSGSSRPRRVAPGWRSSMPGCRTRRVTQTSGSRPGLAPRRPCCSAWPGSCWLPGVLIGSSPSAGSNGGLGSSTVSPAGWRPSTVSSNVCSTSTLASRQSSLPKSAASLQRQ